MEFSLLPRLLIQSFGSGLFVFSFLRSNSKCHAASAILKLRRCPPYPGIFDPFTNWTAILWMMLKPQKAKGFWKKGPKLKPKDKRKSSYHLLWGFDMIWAAVSGIVSGVMLMSLDISSFTSQLTILLSFNRPAVRFGRVKPIMRRWTIIITWTRVCCFFFGGGCNHIDFL